MDKKRYKKTRYQNIYKNIKNGNYIVQISNPKTTISKDKNNNKIFDINLAKEIRDNKSNRVVKMQQISNKDIFEKIWDLYIIECKEKLAYKTCRKKIIFYNRFFKKYFEDLKLSKINKHHINDFMSKIDTTNKEKNEISTQLKAFFNWCVKKDYLFINPASNVEIFKTEKKEMHYWLPEHLKSILEVLNNEIKNNTNVKIAYMMKIFIMLCFSLGARTGEIRALRFCDVSKEFKTISINHSIEYNPNSHSYLKDTKNKYSKRKIDVSDKLINEILKYRAFLEKNSDYEINNDTIIFINHRTKRPYSDTVLRKHFYYYVEKAKVPKIRMYDLRHTYVTTMLSDGFDIYAISKRIGHTNIQTTINVYGHLSEKIKKEMAISTDKYIN